MNPKEDIENAFRILVREMVENKVKNIKEENDSKSLRMCFIY